MRVGSGAGGPFLADVPFNCLRFDRLVATLGAGSTAVSLIGLADSLGCIGVVSLLMAAGLVASWLYFSGKTRARR